MPTVRLPFRPFDEVRTVPNVVVDGAPNEATTLALSHWPGTVCPDPDLAADLSAQMSFRYLGHPTALHGDAQAVTNNHFDQDGLVSVFALSQPDAAMARREVLEDLAAAGDFGTYGVRDAARASMVVSAFADPDRSPLGAVATGHAERTAELYTELLGRLVELVDHIDRFREFWADEDAQLSECEAAVRNGDVQLAEHPEVDLAVVTVPDGRRWSGHRFGGRRYDGVHPMAIHNATDRTGLLLIADGTFRFTYRYETWVQYRSRPVPRRVQLRPLAELLTEADEVLWSSDPIEEITPELGPVNGSASGLRPDQVIQLIADHLRSAPPAFDPFAPPTNAGWPGFERPRPVE